MMRVKRVQDDKTVKRKVKKATKDAIRELKKDTAIVMEQKEKERLLRKGVSKKNTFHINQNLKDEI